MPPQAGIKSYSWQTIYAGTELHSGAGNPQCVHRHRFESLAHASRVIADWVGFYNYRRTHQALVLGHYIVGAEGLRSLRQE
ncbi:integrase core domain-containing protein [Chromobacterium sp. IIBBL 290-4]|uniref:integrase core domain-containing protein n=1 Tax=Chromobacterium sp. IIBBL 290-4 TaxID=2953890 RepID=UPI00353191D4